MFQSYEHDKDYLSLHRFNNGFLYTSAFWLFSSSFFSSSEDPSSFSPVFQLPCLWENKVLLHFVAIELFSSGLKGHLVGYQSARSTHHSKWGAGGENINCRSTAGFVRGEPHRAWPRPPYFPAYKSFQSHISKKKHHEEEKNSRFGV